MAMAHFVLNSHHLIPALAADGYTGRVAGPDAGDNHMMADPPGFGQKSLCQECSQALSLRLGPEVEGRFNSVRVNGGFGPKGEAGIAEDKAAAFGDQKRISRVLVSGVPSAAIIYTQRSKIAREEGAEDGSVENFRQRRQVGVAG